MSRVMISYSHKQADIATRLHESLKLAGVHPKLDQIDLVAGERWRRTIAGWLSACETAVVLLCPQAAASAWVQYELSVLANRALAAQNLRLVLVYLATDPTTMAAQREFLPCQLGEFEVKYRFATPDLTDAELKTLADDVAGSQPASVANGTFHNLVDLAYQAVEGLPSSLVASAQDKLAGPATVDDDGWVFHPADSQSATRAPQWAFARTFAATSIVHATGAFFRLAECDAFTEHKGDGLMNVGFAATVDPMAAVLVTSAHGGSGPPALVLAGTQEISARSAVLSIQTVTRRANSPRIFVHSGQLSSLSMDDHVDAVEAWLRNEILNRCHGDEDEARHYLADMKAAEVPIFLVFKTADSLSDELVQRIVARVDPMKLLILASEHRAPAASGEHLGLPVAGPLFSGEDWKEFRDNENLLSELQQRIPRVMKSARKAS